LITASFDIVNPGVFNELFRAMREDVEACLHLRSRDDGSLLLVMLSKVTLEKDVSGVFILDGETDMGHATGRLFAVPADEVMGRLTVTTT